MHTGFVAAIGGAVALCASASAEAPSFEFITQSGYWTLYGDRSAADTGRFLNQGVSQGLSIRVRGSQVGGRDETFNNMTAVIDGTYGPYAIVDQVRRSVLMPSSFRLQDAQGQVLLTIYFDSGSMDWSVENSTALGWQAVLFNDRAAPSRAERGPLLDDVVPPGTMPSVRFTSLGRRFAPPGNNNGVLEFLRGQVTSWATMTFSYACRADLNNDSVVDDADFTGFLQSYAVMACQRGDPCRADFDDDGFVDDADFAAFAKAYDRLLCD